MDKAKIELCTDDTDCEMGSMKARPESLLGSGRLVFIVIV